MWSALAKDAWRQGQSAPDAKLARQWLERARRIAPDDQTVALSLAMTCLRGGDPAEARRLFQTITAAIDVCEAWLGLAASALQTGDPTAAVTAMQAALSRHAASEAVRSLAASVARAAEWAGWCAVDSAGRLYADAAADLTLDGRRIRRAWTNDNCALPPGECLVVERNGAPLLGSPIDLRAMNAIEGFVAAEAGGLSGWAWHPRNPDRDPVLCIAGKRVVARVRLDNVATHQPLSRPRQFRIAAADLPARPVSVTDTAGQHLLGSPIDPGLEIRSATGLDSGFKPVWADVVGPGRRTTPRRRPVDVVVPVYRGLRTTLACLNSVLATIPRGSRVHVVDDAGPDAALSAALDELAAGKRIILHRLLANRGFPGSANAGLRAAAGRDVVLLNSDTVVPPGWMQHLSDAAYSAPDIGSACPLSNDATILSYPKRAGGNPMPDPVPLAALARRANGAGTVEIPVAVGFCMFIRHDCAAAVGLLREDIFAQGYGEENDWCLRARHRGWRHVAATGCFVAHEGGASFGPARQHLQARNATVLNRLHPGYEALIGAWIKADPLGPARQRIDLLRWRAGRRKTAVVLLAHAHGGGVERVVADRAAAMQAAGVRPVVLRPDGDATVVGEGDTPNLRYRLPGDWPALLRLLKAERVERVELHHSLGQHPALLDLAARLGVAQDVFIHDYASFCARIQLVPEHSYCGEPPVAQCVACVADHGSNLDEPIGPVELVARSAMMLAQARQVVAPASDVATRIRRHFPLVRPVVVALEDDTAIPPPPPTPASVRHLCVVGGIGIEKGYEVLLGCVRDAAARRLPLRFTVVGFTFDDERLLAAGPVFVTGKFASGEGEALMRRQKADIAFIPSIWPETWCFALGEAWRAGLRAMVFDIGAPAERVRSTGWGHTLPLGLSPSAINDWVLRGGAAGVESLRKQHFAAITPSPSSQIPAK